MRLLQSGIDLSIGEFFEGLENVFGGRVDGEQSHTDKDKAIPADTSQPAITADQVAGSIANLRVTNVNQTLAAGRH